MAVRALLRRLYGYLQSKVPTVFSEDVGISGKVETEVYDAERIQTEIPDWKELNGEERIAVLEDVEPSEGDETSNVILDDWNEFLVDLFDQSQTVSLQEITHFAVGTDGSAASSSDTGLGTEVFRSTIDSADDNARDLDITGIIDSTEANGNTLREVMFTTGASGTGEKNVNRAIISEIVKDDTKIVTITGTIQHRSG